MRSSLDPVSNDGHVSVRRRSRRRAFEAGMPGRIIVLPRARTPFRRRIRSVALLSALLIAAGGYVHFCLYRHGYRTIPKIGVGLLLQTVTSGIVVVALLLGPHRVARITRVAHVTDRLAGAMTELAAAALAMGTLAAFALTRTPGGLFNFQ